MTTSVALIVNAYQASDFSRYKILEAYSGIAVSGTTNIVDVTSTANQTFTITCNDLLVIECSSPVSLALTGGSTITVNSLFVYTGSQTLTVTVPTVGTTLKMIYS